MATHPKILVTPDLKRNSLSTTGSGSVPASPLPYQPSPSSSVDSVDAAPIQNVNSGSKLNSSGGNAIFNAMNVNQASGIPRSPSDTSPSKLKISNTDLQINHSVTSPIKSPSVKSLDKFGLLDKPGMFLEGSHLERKQISEKDSLMLSIKSEASRTVMLPQLPFETMQLFNTIESKLRFGSMTEKRFIEYLQQLKDKILASIPTSTLLGSMSLNETNTQLRKVLHFIKEEDFVTQDYWLHHPVFNQVEWLRQYLNKHFMLNKMEPLSNPAVFKTMVELILRMITIQNKGGQNLSHESRHSALTMLQTIHQKGIELIKFSELSYQLFPTLLKEYSKAYSKFITKLKLEIECFDKKRCEEAFERFKRHQLRDAECFSKQPMPNYEIFNNLHAIKKATEEFHSKPDHNGCSIIYHKPKLTFRGTSDTTECTNAWLQSPELIIEQRKQGFTNDIKQWNKSILEAQLSVPSFLFPDKNRARVKPRSRILWPKGKETAILMLPVQDFKIDPVFLELDDKGYGQLIFYYECISESPTATQLNLEIYLKLSQSQQHKLYHYVLELPYSLDDYIPLYNLWFDGKICEPKDLLSMKYSAFKLSKEQLNTLVLTPLPSNTFPDIETFAGRYPPSKPYTPLKASFFDKLKFIPLKNFDKTKKHAEEYLVKCTQREWEYCGKQLFEKLWEKKNEEGSLSEDLHSINALYDVIESIGCFCFGSQFLHDNTFKFLRDASVHDKFHQFSYFVNLLGTEAHLLEPLERLVENLNLGMAKLQDMNLRPSVPYLCPLLETLEEDCIEAFKFQGQVKEQVKEQVKGQVTGDGADLPKLHKQFEEAIHALKLQHAREIQSIQQQLNTMHASQALFQDEIRLQISKLLPKKEPEVSANKDSGHPSAHKL